MWFRELFSAIAHSVYCISRSTLFWTSEWAGMFVADVELSYKNFHRQNLKGYSLAWIWMRTWISTGCPCWLKAGFLIKQPVVWKQVVLLEGLCCQQVLPFKTHIFLTQALQEVYQFAFDSTFLWKSCLQLVWAPCIYIYNVHTFFFFPDPWEVGSVYRYGENRYPLCASHQQWRWAHLCIV